MFIPPLAYAAPRSLSEAVALLHENHGRYLALAGGTDILPAIKERRGAPEGLVSLRYLKELRGIRLGPLRAVVGAATPIARLAGGITDRNPAFGDFLRQMGSPQIRNRATLGGNLCTAAACADSPGVLLVSRACLHVFGPKGARTIAFETFHRGPRPWIWSGGGGGGGWDADRAGIREDRPAGWLNISVVGVAAISVRAGLVTSLRLLPAASGRLAARECYGDRGGACRARPGTAALCEFATYAMSARPQSPWCSHLAQICISK